MLTNTTPCPRLHQQPQKSGTTRWLRLRDSKMGMVQSFKTTNHIQPDPTSRSWACSTVNHPIFGCRHSQYYRMPRYSPHCPTWQSFPVLFKFWALSLPNKRRTTPKPRAWDPTVTAVGNMCMYMCIVYIYIYRCINMYIYICILISYHIKSCHIINHISYIISYHMFGHGTCSIHVYMYSNHSAATRLSILLVDHQSVWG